MSLVRYERRSRRSSSCLGLGDPVLEVVPSFEGLTLEKSLGKTRRAPELSIRWLLVRRLLCIFMLEGTGGLGDWGTGVVVVRRYYYWSMALARLWSTRPDTPVCGCRSPRACSPSQAKPPHAADVSVHVAHRLGAVRLGGLRWCGVQGGCDLVEGCKAHECVRDAGLCARRSCRGGGRVGWKSPGRCVGGVDWLRGVGTQPIERGRFLTVVRRVGSNLSEKVVRGHAAV